MLVEHLVRGAKKSKVLLGPVGDGELNKFLLSTDIFSSLSAFLGSLSDLRLSRARV